MLQPNQLVEKKRLFSVVGEILLGKPCTRPVKILTTALCDIIQTTAFLKIGHFLESSLESI